MRWALDRQNNRSPDTAGSIASDKFYTGYFVAGIPCGCRVGCKTKPNIKTPKNNIIEY
jgi:hypothetical protein